MQQRGPSDTAYGDFWACGCARNRLCLNEWRCQDSPDIPGKKYPTEFSSWGRQFLSTIAKSWIQRSDWQLDEFRYREQKDAAARREDVYYVPVSILQRRSADCEEKTPQDFRIGERLQILPGVCQTVRSSGPWPAACVVQGAAGSALADKVEIRTRI